MEKLSTNSKKIVLFFILYLFFPMPIYEPPKTLCLACMPESCSYYEGYWSYFLAGLSLLSYFIRLPSFICDIGKTCTAIFHTEGVYIRFVWLKYIISAILSYLIVRCVMRYKKFKARVN